MEDNEASDPNTPLPSDEELEAMVGELLEAGSPEEMAREVLKAGLVPAVQTIVNLSQTGHSERIKLDAAKYVVERNLGKETLGGDIWDALLKEFSGGTDKK